MTAGRSPLKHLAPGWYAMVMGLTGLSLAWHAAVPLLGEGAGAGAVVIGALAALVFIALAVAGAWRLRRHPEAWAEDLRHPVRHVFVAAMPISVILLATAALACQRGWPPPPLGACVAGPRGARPPRAGGTSEAAGVGCSDPRQFAALPPAASLRRPE